MAPEDEAVYTYQRQLGDKKVRVIANFTDQTQQRANAAVKAVMMSNYPDQQLTTDQITLRPYEAVMLEIE